MPDYRVDYMRAGATVETVEYPRDRAEAMTLARKRSREHGTAYAIRSDDDRDTGQRVYDRGFFSYREGEF